MLRAFVIVCVVAASSAPAAVARHAPDDFAGPHRVAPLTFSVTDELDARLGPKYVPLPQPPVAGTPPVAAVRGGSPSKLPFRLVLIAPTVVLLALVVVARLGAAHRRATPQRGSAPSTEVKT
jgi:hypothetical protein